nr:hypothetical protein [Paracoccus saliphilus]
MPLIAPFGGKRRFTYEVLSAWTATAPFFCLQDVWPQAFHGSPQELVVGCRTRPHCQCTTLNMLQSCPYLSGFDDRAMTGWTNHKAAAHLSRGHAAATAFYIKQFGD